MGGLAQNRFTGCDRTTAAIDISASNLLCCGYFNRHRFGRSVDAGGCRVSSEGGLTGCRLKRISLFPAASVSVRNILAA